MIIPPCPLCAALDEIAAQCARDARGAAPIVWHAEAAGWSYEEPDLLLTVESVSGGIPE